MQKMCVCKNVAWLGWVWVKDWVWGVRVLHAPVQTC
jgi:hypothetical protein